MLNFIKQLILASMICCISPNLIAQNPGSIGYLEKVLRSYQEMDILSMHIEAYAYSDLSAKRGEKLMTGEMKINKDKYYSKMDGIEMIVVGDRMTVVDHQDKVISLGRSKPISQLKKEQPVFSMDSLMKAGAKVFYKGMEKENVVYSMELSNSYIKSLELHIDHDGMIAKMIHYFLSVPELESAYYKMEILFSNISKSSSPSSYFDEKKFVKNRQAKTPTAAFRHYLVEEVDYSASVYQN